MYIKDLKIQEISIVEEDIIYKRMGFPKKEGLYDPKNEHDSNSTHCLLQQKC